MARDLFLVLVDTIKEKRKAAVLALSSGHWNSEAEGRQLVGTIQAYNETLNAMRDIAGPGTAYGEEEL